MSYDLDKLNSDELMELSRHLQSLAYLKGMADAAAERDFTKWATAAFGWSLNKIEDAWRWFRKNVLKS